MIVFRFEEFYLRGLLPKTTLSAIIDVSNNLRCSWPLLQEFESVSSQPYQKPIPVAPEVLDATSLLSGENATALTECEWPSSVRRAAPVAASPEPDRLVPGCERHQLTIQRECHSTDPI